MPAQALDRNVKIINDTSYDIVEFYGSQVDAKTWEEDILGSDILRSGSTVDVNFDDGTGYCLFDFPPFSRMATNSCARTSTSAR